jgi:uncharacterized phage protein (TIGR02218 family)
MSDVTTFCSLWKLDIPARDSLFMTDHDDVIDYDGDRYIPQNSADAARAELRSGLSVDSGGFRTILSGSGISSQDIRDGALDGASLSHFRRDWRSGETSLLFKGRIGEVSLSGTDIAIEWLGQASLLDQSTGRVYSRQCDASFGDARCGVDASAFPDGTTCPRRFAACRDQFQNAVNFRGFPYLLGDDALAAGVRESDPRDGSSRYS